MGCFATIIFEHLAAKQRTEDLSGLTPAAALDTLDHLFLFWTLCPWFLGHSSHLSASQIPSSQDLFFSVCSYLMLPWGPASALFSSHLTYFFLENLTFSFKLCRDTSQIFSSSLETSFLVSRSQCLTGLVFWVFPWHSAVNVPRAECFLLRESVLFSI